ncbi:unnamed protein product [Didymodactylos carnosus]|uniref:FMP27/BLTP2/Hobbit GFWDK motif-containing RBG unit domain-containing protein n=1 Tax=Didymodactylos carnosus TaxID=1234261 RepID=A0A8S2D6Y6_9BILA|nr:unnamed protein product [Didymodactylos carnosus]CAF3637795.1 unnamed protein product [Didymodactylos carnosus]
MTELLGWFLCFYLKYRYDLKIKFGGFRFFEIENVYIEYISSVSLAYSINIKIDKISLPIRSFIGRQTPTLYFQNIQFNAKVVLLKQRKEKSHISKTNLIHDKINVLREKVRKYLLKYVAVHISYIESHLFFIQHDKQDVSHVTFSFRQISLHSSNHEMYAGFEQLQFLFLTAKINETVTNEIFQDIPLKNELLLIKLTLSSFEVQTNFHQRFIININNWDFHFNEDTINYVQDYVTDSLTSSSTSSASRSINSPPSKFRYYNTALLAPTSPIPLSFSPSLTLSDWFEFLDSIDINISIRRISSVYTTHTSTETIEYFIDYIRLYFRDENYHHQQQSTRFSLHDNLNSAAIKRNTNHFTENVKRNYSFDLNVQNIQDKLKLTKLASLQCQTQISSSNIDIDFHVKNLNLFSNENEINRLQYILNKFKPTQLQEMEQTNKSRLSQFMQENNVRLNLRLSHTCLKIKLDTIQQYFILHSHNLTLSADKTMTARYCVDLKNLIFIYENGNNLGDDRQQYYEGNDDNLKCLLLDTHPWNCLLFITHATMQLSMKDHELNIQLDVNCTRLLINKILASLIDRLIYLIRKQSISNKYIASSSSKQSLIFNILLKKIHCILVDTLPVYMCITISDILIQRTQIEFKKIFAHFSNQNKTKALTFPLSSDRIFDVKRFHIQLHDNRIHIVFPNDVRLLWTTKLHLFLHRLSQQLKLSTNSQSLSSNDHQKKRQFDVFLLEFQSSLRLQFYLSDNCVTCFDLSQIQITHRFDIDQQIPVQFQLQCKEMIIDFNKQSTFICENINFQRQHYCDWLSTERVLLQKTIKTLSVLANKTNIVEFSKFSIHFPFASQFNQVLEKIINIKKWLTKLHRNEPILIDTVPTHTITNDMWSDLVIKCSLMADEYCESEMRSDELERRISEQHTLTDESIADMRRALSEAGSNVYVKRSKALHVENTEQYTRHLIKWSVKEVRIIAIADQAWTGKQNILQMMKQIDYESPQPAASTDFSVLWCRYALFDCKEWRLIFRDFPQPLWEMLDFHLWGHLCASESTPEDVRSTRCPYVEISHPYENVQVQRLISPLKFYHDFNSDTKSFLFAYGPCWEGCLAQLNLCLNSILPQTRDPSPLLSWWDKLRLYLHGRFSMACDKLSWLYHITFNPYNNSEEMEWLWEKCYMDWTNGKFLFHGNLSIKIRTSSKYDDCCLLYLPNVDARVNINWLCSGNLNDHHSVRLYNVESIPKEKVEKLMSELDLQVPEWQDLNLVEDQEWMTQFDKYWPFRTAGSTDWFDGNIF